MKRLVVRADASSRIGAGHVMRCLALAQAWEGPVRFVSEDPPEWVRARLAQEGFELGTTLEGADWVLADGYHFTPADLREFRRTAPVLFFDDVPRLADYPVDLVWNPNLGACPSPYVPTRALTGPAYYPLRREFLQRGPRQDHPARARRLVITMGGADPDGYTGVALQAARDLDLEVRVVVGASNPRRDELLARLAPAEVADVNDMPGTLAWGEFALTAAGVTSYELAWLGIPSLLVELADNQTPGARAWDAEGGARNLGPPPPRPHEALAELAADPQTRRRLAQRAREIVDGLGVERVIAAL